MLKSHTIEINRKLLPVFQIGHLKGSISARNLTRFGKGAIYASRIQHLSHEMSNVNNAGNYGWKTITFPFLSIRACAIMILPLFHPPPPAALSLSPSDCFRIVLELKELLSACLLTRPFINSGCCFSACLCHHGNRKALSLSAGTSSSA